jgi:hypothetical protein
MEKTTNEAITIALKLLIKRFINSSVGICEINMIICISSFKDGETEKIFLFFLKSKITL